MAFTSYDMAELFVNGVSQGVRRKEKASTPTLGGQEESLEGRYRLIWEDVPYESGELKVTALSGGKTVMEKTVRTAGKPHHIELETSANLLKADGKDLAYVTATVVDDQGTPCPEDSSLLSFKVSGAGSFRAAANGDPTCLDLFHVPKMHAFSGRLSILVQAGTRPGKAVLEVSGEGLEKGIIAIKVKR